MGDAGHDSDLELPIKIEPCSNGEFVPPPMTAIQAETIRRTHEAADTQSRLLGMSRRKFLRSVSGAALMLLTRCVSIERARKTMAWRMRARVGERMQWWEDVNERMDTY